jgi:hypothetical protein
MPAARPGAGAGDLAVGRFWTLQLIEGGPLLAITAVTLGAAVWLLHRRIT